MTTEVPVTFLGRVRRDRALGIVAPINAGARLINGRRIEEAAGYPQMESMRDRTRAIRLDALGRLDELLARFAGRVEAGGGHVYFAATGDEAADYIRALASREGVSTIVKSKSMVTEEIELNEALEHDGLETVETDLGEFIIQLAGEKPSHIIAPVLHKTRQQIGALFAERLDVPYTDDPTELNAIARTHLREIFLAADMGISGCNMAIADTGSIVLVTNEGNGRLTTTAPRIHVVVMGMERIVESMPDAATVLEVLARSATGQRLSVYTNVITGPRRPADPDGPEQLHVVILDNGRSQTLAGSEAEILACIRCGACLNVCPVYREVGGHAYGFTYSGPIGAVLTPSLQGLDTWHELPYASTLCGACEDVCPVRIQIPQMLLSLRARSAEEGNLPGWLRRGIRIYARAATRPARFRRLLKAGGLAGRVLAKEGWIEKAPSHGAAWTGARDLPQPATRSFHQRWKEQNRGT
ncbi:MAG: LutB/LldF family L-lactate oxidation iron-sulfur protein [Acidimicrobiia bacterium]|nr:LutB/LldF family L-lactate oxidation iron-sulfur protein [Acidimicrobiia bacterium]